MSLVAEKIGFNPSFPQEIRDLPGNEKSQLTAAPPFADHFPVFRPPGGAAFSPNGSSGEQKKAGRGSLAGFPCLQTITSN